jgi:hypothetical protein
VAVLVTAVSLILRAGAKGSFHVCPERGISLVSIVTKMYRMSSQVIHLSLTTLLITSGKCSVERLTATEIKLK